MSPPVVSIDDVEPYTVMKGDDGFDYIVDIDLATMEKSWSKMVDEGEGDEGAELLVRESSLEVKERDVPKGKGKKAKKSLVPKKAKAKDFDLDDNLCPEQYLVTPEGICDIAIVITPKAVSNDPDTKAKPKPKPKVKATMKVKQTEPVVMSDPVVVKPKLKVVLKKCVQA